jgi:hypothetical protein
VKGEHLFIYSLIALAFAAILVVTFFNVGAH